MNIMVNRSPYFNVMPLLLNTTQAQMRNTFDIYRANKFSRKHATARVAMDFPNNLRDTRRNLYFSLAAATLHRKTAQILTNPRERIEAKYRALESLQNARRIRSSAGAGA